MSLQKILIASHTNAPAPYATATSPALGGRQNEENDDWLEKTTEGLLAVDVYQTKECLVIKSAIAGVTTEQIDISIDNDIVTIRGTRLPDEAIEEEEREYLYQECYFGSFSRSIILPVEIDADRVRATFKNGILTITLPKLKKQSSVSIQIHGDDT